MSRTFYCKQIHTNHSSNKHFLLVLLLEMCTNITYHYYRTIYILDKIGFLLIIFKSLTVIWNKHTLACTGMNVYDTRLILCSLPSLNIFFLLILMKNSYCRRYFNWKKKHSKLFSSRV